jgi:hypothetical protein
MLATTMQVAVRSEIVRGLRAEEPVFTGDHLAVTALGFNREVVPAPAGGSRNLQPGKRAADVSAALPVLKMP